jgi:hypothetical protein
MTNVDIDNFASLSEVPIHVDQIQLLCDLKKEMEGWIPRFHTIRSAVEEY